jgi:hypothetical protein
MSNFIDRRQHGYQFAYKLVPSLLFQGDFARNLVELYPESWSQLQKWFERLSRLFPQEQVNGSHLSAPMLFRLSNNEFAATIELPNADRYLEVRFLGFVFQPTVRLFAQGRSNLEGESDRWTIREIHADGSHGPAGITRQSSQEDFVNVLFDFIGCSGKVVEATQEEFTASSNTVPVHQKAGNTDSIENLITIAAMYRAVSLLVGDTSDLVPAAVVAVCQERSDLFNPLINEILSSNGNLPEHLQSQAAFHAMLREVQGEQKTCEGSEPSLRLKNKGGGILWFVLGASLAIPGVAIVASVLATGVINSTILVGLGLMALGGLSIAWGLYGSLWSIEFGPSILLRYGLRSKEINWKDVTYVEFDKQESSLTGITIEHDAMTIRLRDGNAYDIVVGRSNLAPLAKVFEKYAQFDYEHEQERRAKLRDEDYRSAPLLTATTASFVFVVGIVVFLSNARQYYHGFQSSNWPIVQGTVRQATWASSENDRSTFRPVFDYVYTLGDREFQGNRFAFFDASYEDQLEVQNLINEFSKQPTTDVFYNPADPELAVLVPGLSWGQTASLLTVGCLQVIALVVAIVGFTRWRARRSEHPVPSASN